MLFVLFINSFALLANSLFHHQRQRSSPSSSRIPSGVGSPQSHSDRYPPQDCRVLALAQAMAAAEVPRPSSNTSAPAPAECAVKQSPLLKEARKADGLKRAFLGHSFAAVGLTGGIPPAPRPCPRVGYPWTPGVRVAISLNVDQESSLPDSNQIPSSSSTEQHSTYCLQQDCCVTAERVVLGVVEIIL